MGDLRQDLDKYHRLLRITSSAKCSSLTIKIIVRLDELP